MFATAARDNLLVARGDCTDVGLLHPLAVAGLAGWLQRLHEGSRLASSAAPSPVANDGACSWLGRCRSAAG